MIRVALLYGGRSAERDVSLVSGRACAAALRDAGFTVDMIDADMPVAELVAALTRHPKPDVVFNALHGRWGEDGTVQGLLELLGLRYTHSGVLASALAMDKIQAKRVLAAAGVPVAEDRLVDRQTLLTGDPIPRPYVIKPCNEGSSVGVYIIEPDTNWRPTAEKWSFGDQVMVEPYIRGREVTVAVMDKPEGGCKALAVTEIVPRFGGFYDYSAKYMVEKAAEHVVPATLPHAAYDEAMRLAEIGHRALGCRGVSRADFRYDDSRVNENGIGRFIMLEINTQPGMTPMSLVPEQAAHLGISFPALCRWMVEAARCDR